MQLLAAKLQHGHNGVGIKLFIKEAFYKLPPGFVQLNSQICGGNKNSFVICVFLLFLAVISLCSLDGGCSCEDRILPASGHSSRDFGVPNSPCLALRVSVAGTEAC